MKRLFKALFILALVLCFTVPAFAIKILPYNVPLQDLMRWDKYGVTLRLSNPEGETLTVSWPANVDLWNYDGSTWTYNLPSGDTFAFGKGVATTGASSFTLSSAATTGTIRTVTITQTMTASGQAIPEALYVVLNTEFITGEWANAIVGRIDYGTTGSAAYGMAAAICAELNMPAQAVPGGVYAAFDAEIEIPDNCVLIDNTLFPVSFFRAGLWGTDKSEFDDHGYLLHLDGITAGTGDLWYGNTLKILVGVNLAGATEWFIPLSSAQASYTTLYPIDVTVGTGTAIDVGTSVTGIGFTGTYSTAAIAIETVGRITFHDALINMYAADDGDLVINADATLIVTSPATEIVATTSLIHRQDAGDYVTYTIADGGAAKVEVTGQVSGTYEIETSHGVILLDAAATITLDAGTGDIETADVFNSTSAIASTSTASGSIQTDGGIGIVGDVFIGGFINVNASAAETLLDFVLETEWVSGTLINADFGSATTLSGSAVGLNLDFSAVHVDSDQAITAIDLTFPDLTFDAVTKAIVGVEISGDTLTQLNSGTGTWTGIDITIPTMVETGGTINAYGIKIVGGTLTTDPNTYGIDLTGTFVHSIKVGATGAGIVYTEEEGAINVAIYSNYTGDTGFFRGLYVESTYTPGDATAAASVYGIRGRVIHAGTSFDSQENMTGVHGQYVGAGDINHEFAVVAGLRGEVSGAGTYTSVRWIAGVTGEIKLTSGINVTGAQACAPFVAYATGDTATAMFYADGYFTNGIDFSGWDGAQGSAFVFASGHGTDTVAHTGSEDGHILVTVSGDVRKIRLYD